MTAEVTATTPADRIAVPPPETRAERAERLRSGGAVPSGWDRQYSRPQVGHPVSPAAFGSAESATHDLHNRRVGYVVMAVIVLVAAIGGVLAYRHHGAKVLAQKCFVQQLTSAQLGQSPIEFYLQYPQCHSQL